MNTLSFQYWLVISALMYFDMYSEPDWIELPECTVEASVAPACSSIPGSSSIKATCGRVPFFRSSKYVLLRKTFDICELAHGWKRVIAVCGSFGCAGSFV